MHTLVARRSFIHGLVQLRHESKNLVSIEHQQRRLGLQTDMTAWQEIRYDAVIPKAGQSNISTRSYNHLLDLNRDEGKALINDSQETTSMMA